MAIYLGSSAANLNKTYDEAKMGGDPLLVRVVSRISIHFERVERLRFVGVLSSPQF